MMLNFLKAPTISRGKKLFELRRKIFHAIAIIFPFITYYFDRQLILKMFAIALPLIIIFDYNNLLRYFIKIPPGSILKKLMREHEMIHGQLCGMSWLFLGYTIILVACDEYLVMLAMTILVFCDAFAALIGQNFGRIKLCEKTLEGTVAFVLVGCAIIEIFQHYLPGQFNSLHLIIAVIVAAITELISKNIRLDDNFSIPLSFCFTYILLQSI